MGEIRNAYKLLVRKPEGNHSKDLGIDGIIILDGYYGNRIGGCGLDSYGSGYGSVDGQTV
jgi:hypothetical protein